MYRKTFKYTDINIQIGGNISIVMKFHDISNLISSDFFLYCSLRESVSALENFLPSWANMRVCEPKI
jgi:hypothetical protein